MKPWAKNFSLFCILGVGAVTAQTPDTSPGPVFGENAPALSPARLLHMDQPGRIAGSYFVKFKSPDAFSKLSEVEALQFRTLPGTLPVSREDVDALAWALAARVAGTEVSLFQGHFNGFSLHASEKEISKLADDPRIDFIEPVLRMKPTAQQVLPSDNTLWALDRIDQRQLPLNLRYDYSTTATTVTVHVLDTGIRATHTELANRPPIFVDHCYSADTSLPTCTTNFTNNPALMDCHGHGTRIASVIGSTTFGVAKQVRMRAYVGTLGAIRSPLGIWFCPSPLMNGDSNDMIMTLDRAITAAANDGTPSIITISQILDGPSNIIDELIGTAINNGITVIVGAGNTTDNSCLFSPARMPPAITVAASNQLDQRWQGSGQEGSNYGNCVDLFAPGENMAAASNGSDTATGATGGTSAATAIVTGIAAMYLEDHEGDNPAEVTAAILQGATANVLQGNLGCASPPGGNCSPNRLAYSSLNGPPSGSLQFFPSSFSQVENGASATIVVTRTVNSLGAVSASYATSSGSATAGSDYTAVSGTLSWASGESGPKSFALPILNDSTYEGNETVHLSLSSPTGGAVLGSPAAATLTIIEDETPPPPPGTIQLAASSVTVPEDVGSVTITATRTGGSGGQVTVRYSTTPGTAVANSDYKWNSPDGTLTWPDGDAANKTFSVVILNDSAAEPDETFSVSIYGPTGGASLGSPTSATVTIQENDSVAPSVPTNLRTQPVGTANGGNYSVLWNASTGSVNHYTLREVRLTGANAPATTDYVVTPPTTSKSFSKGGIEREFEYSVRACATATEAACSGWSAPVNIGTCPSGGCRN